jgi:hypothetical protein
MARGAVENRPRYRLGLESGVLAVMAAADVELGYAGIRRMRPPFGRPLRGAALPHRHTRARRGDRSGQARAVAYRCGERGGREVPRPGATSLGVIGCGWQAESQVECIRVAVPSIERVVAYCRTESRLSAFCERHGAEPGESHRDPAECDVVVTVTGSPDPVLRGEWLQPGALVCAVGANDGRRRELDQVVLERASFVCCDSIENARLESADLIEPIEAGVLDWLECTSSRRSLQARPRADRATTTSSSSSRTGSRRGTPRLRPPSSAASAGSERFARRVDVLLAERLHNRAVEETQLLLLASRFCT